MMQGLLDDPLFNFGIGMLANGGYSDRPVTLGQQIAGGVQNMRSAEDAGLNRAMKKSAMKKAEADAKREQMWQGLLGGGGGQFGEPNGLAADGQQLAQPAFSGLLDSPHMQKLKPLLALMPADEGMKMVANSMMPGSHPGGGTGWLIERAMSDPEFKRNLFEYQTGWRGGVALSPDGKVVPMAGAPEARGAVKQGEAAGQRVGTEIGETQVGIASQGSKLPQLNSTVDKLSELGKKATYTFAGRSLDGAMRELGLSPRESSVAREEYIAMVDNQILPLLRDTFGAQFTQKEGESLKATLGSPDKSPEEKDAVLRSFITQKMATLASEKRKLENLQNRAPQASPQSANSVRVMHDGAVMEIDPSDLQEALADGATLVQ